MITIQGAASSPRSASQVLLRIVYYMLACLLMAISTGLLLLLRSDISPELVALLYLVPVAIATALWGLGPGITSALLAFLSLNYFFIEPYYSLVVHHTQDLLGLVLFLGIAVGINMLLGWTRRNLAIAEVRQHEAIRLYELASLLSGLQDEEAIARSLANQIQDAFQAQRVEVLVEAQSSGHPIQVSSNQLPAAGPSPSPIHLVPLQSARSLLGEIRIWREAPTFNSEEERLLNAFAGQGVLALERARLTQAATQTKLLEESDRLKTAILSSVSHELRSPLAAIKAAVTSLRSGDVEWNSEAAAELLAVIEEDTDHLNQLVGNLLDMSRLEAGALQLQRRWNVLLEIVREAIQRQQQEIKQHPIQIAVSEDLPLVPVDFELIAHVFTNLLSNSLKYSPVDTIILIEAQPLDNQTLLVRVQNQGPGVLEADLERIFDKFYRITAAERITGTGLGLSICKGIIEAHGGRIWAENVQGGFAFLFTLPLKSEQITPLVVADKPHNL
jgi:two-component system, OmpR family, sensor histidine kinase KdpD